MFVNSPTRRNLPLASPVPRSNIAVVNKSAVVIEGVSRFRNTLLNGDIHRYDWDTGYTCHQVRVKDHAEREWELDYCEAFFAEGRNVKRMCSIHTFFYETKNNKVRCKLTL